MNAIRRLLIGLLCLFNLKVAALDAHLRQLVDWETQFNAISMRSSESLLIPHYEIPLTLVEQLQVSRFNPVLRRSLVFERQGIQFVRWIVNPEDRQWYKDIEAWMIANQLEPERHYYFIGYKTASRSYIVEDPETQAQFGIKSSTDVTGGKWSDKKQTFRDAVDVIKTNEYIADVIAKEPFENLLIIPDSLAFGVKSLDQAIVVRDLSVLNKDKYYLPGFSGMHEKLGKNIALRNGYIEPLIFWEHFYVRPMAWRLGEFFVRLGIIYDSPHSQNFLIEFDEQMRPTGRLVFRDFGDIYVLKKFFETIGRKDYLDSFSTPANISNNPELMFGPLHGNNFPKWITPKEYERWGHIYHLEFSLALKHFTKIETDLLDDSYKMDDGYFNKQIDWELPIWEPFFSALKDQSSKKAARGCIEALN